MRVLSQYYDKKLNAGPKAKKDIENILETQYKAKIKHIKVNDEDLENQLKKIIFKIKKMFLFIDLSNKKDTFILQFPIVNDKRIVKMFKKKIFIIHDIEGLRTNDETLIKKEIEIYNQADCIIVHNEKMLQYLKANGLKKPMICIELFDYLVNGDIEEIKEGNPDTYKIVYAGNLLKEKSPFLYQLEQEKMKYEIALYGIGIKENINEKIKYMGAYSPDELPSKIRGNLGLVWDGNLDESDENEGFKNYTKYNNPHKLSCYIAAGLPVIVWEKAAIAELVKKYDIGYTINNLYDINNINFNDYTQKLQNIKELSKKVRTGYFTKKVIDKSMEAENGKI